MVREEDRGGGGGSWWGRESRKRWRRDRGRRRRWGEGVCIEEPAGYIYDERIQKDSLGGRILRKQNSSAVAQS